MGMLGGLTIEQSARRDFLLSHLLTEERNRSEALLLNMLPASIAERLKVRHETIADHFPEVTVLFADIRPLVRVQRNEFLVQVSFRRAVLRTLKAREFRP